MENKFTQFNCDFDKKSYEKLNSQFAKVRIRIAYDGLNRNDSIIPKNVLEKMSKTSLFNIPIVGEYSEEKKNFLGHGGKLEISDEGFKFIDTTRPYGVIPSNTEVYWEKILDKNGYDEHEYLCCTGILWHGRYPEVEKVLDDGANQSMEIQVIDAEFTEDYKFLIKDAEFSALCILGKDDYHPKDDPNSTNVEPCFEDACITRYSANDFKAEFKSMLEQYQKFNLENSSLDINDTRTELDHNKESVDNNNEEEINLVNETNIQLNQELVNAKLYSVINDTKYRSNIDKHYNKYIILSNTDSSVNVIDREDCYKIYNISYLATETADGIIVNVDYDNKIEKSFGIVDKTDDIFNIQNEIEMISLDTSTFKIAEHQSAAINKLTEDLDVMTDNFNNSQVEIARLKNQLEIFEKEKNEILTTKHKESIDTLIDSKYEEMKDFSEYSIYRADIDYTKSMEDVAKDIKDIHYNFLSSKKPDNRNKFSAIQSHVIGNDGYDAEYDDIAREYGADVAKYFKKNK